MDENALFDTSLELIRRNTAYLPRDILSVFQSFHQQERSKQGRLALGIMSENIGRAAHLSRPLCQDTGWLSYYITMPLKSDPLLIKRVLEKSVQRATVLGYLRQNSVNSLSGVNSGNNRGPGMPDFHFDFHESDEMEIRLIQKGGGCENMSAQYTLPCRVAGHDFGRDLKGVRACILDAVHQAQGKGCSPGFLGVCIGGDRVAGYAWAKRQFLRTMDDVNPVGELAKMESDIVKASNGLGIGPMGFGGHFTVGACKIGTRNRLPASFFVSIAYMCWAFRRRGVVTGPDGHPKRWLYQAPDEFDGEAPPPLSASRAGRSLKLPLTNADVQSLHVGEVVLLNGSLFTGRDAVHKYLFEGHALSVFKNAALYHCGPIMKKDGNHYRVVAAGPTTSIREEPYQADIIKKYGIKAVIGKGGMGEKTRAACQKYGCVYLHAVGGAAQIYAHCIKRVKNVYLEQFGSPEAVWELEVENFPVMVTIDAHGKSWHEETKNGSEKRLKEIL